MSVILEWRSWNDDLDSWRSPSNAAAGSCPGSGRRCRQLAVGGFGWPAVVPSFSGKIAEEHDAGDVLGYCAFSRPWFAVVAMLCAVVAVGLQIAVNYLNDYADGVRGTDARRGSDAAGPRRWSLPEWIPVTCCWLPRSLL